MVRPIRRLGHSGTVNARSNYLWKSAGALAFALSAMPMGVLANCTDAEFCTAFGTGALFRNSAGEFNTASGFGALYSNTVGELNTASGYLALSSNTTGAGNTASGGSALTKNTTGEGNTASGSFALYSNTTGDGNTASGSFALGKNTTGRFNTANGAEALGFNTKGLRNLAIGYRALKSNTTGSDNIALGNAAGSVPATASSSIHIGHVGVVGETKVIRLGTQGTQIKTFIGGIRGAAVSGGAAVVVSSAGQLGVVSSSRRYKEDIKPMADASAALMQLKPVTFRYRETDAQGHKPVQFGLIAEEVAEVMPEMVVRDDQGQPETVAYHLLPSLLLNEYQKQQVMLVEVTARAEQDRAKLADVEARASREVAALRDALATRDMALAAMQAEMKALRQVTQQLMTTLPSGNSVGMQER